MKKSLGRFFLVIFFVLNINIFASTYEWSAVANKKSAFVNEAIHLEYICKFSDRGELYFISFNPITENKDYSIKLLSETERIVDGKRVNSYEFVAFVKKAKKIDFKFDAMMKLTTRKSIENTVIGRDNMKKEYFTFENIKQKTLTVDVLDAKSDLVGNFTLETKYNQNIVKAHEPFHFDLNINGVGNFQDFKPIVLKMDNIKIVSEKPDVKTILTKDGYSGVYIQKFVFIGDKDFIIPAINIDYFELSSRSVKKLEAKQVEVKVGGGYKKSELLDLNEVSVLKFKKESLYFLLSFVAGFLVSKIKIERKNKILTISEKLKKDIAAAKTVDEIMFILALQNKKEFSEVVRSIENSDIVSLKKIKKNLFQLIPH
ncbi:hypothetical protein [Sulfurimonas sp.]|uniref:hypothetical protein n=1 Tax=Sulfurimonas sp. TaxID=2022749 RepID=UPI00260140CC|nr:hypothetical protein [Sulfurimonas sp.]MDD5158198.1 hypothetical protein [Sulfurimonas sp.]